MEQENYNKYLDDMYKDRPEERPSDSDPRNPILWAQAVGGPNRGRMRGVSGKADPLLLGYPTTKRQARHVPSFDNNIIQMSESRKAVEEQLQRERLEDREKINEELEKIRSEREQMTEEREQLKSEREQLRSERDQLKMEKEQFMSEISQKVEAHLIEVANSAQKEQEQMNVQQQQQHSLRQLNKQKDKSKKNGDDNTSGSKFSCSVFFLNI